MILPDVNVLLYAFRVDSPGHRSYRSWLESVINGQEAYGYSPQVLSSVIRIATHPRIYARPSKTEDAISYARVLRSQPNASPILPGDRHWGIFESLCRESAASGNLVQDAWFAALAIESGCEWITVDRDYSRFKGLRWRPPF